MHAHTPCPLLPRLHVVPNLRSSSGAWAVVALAVTVADRSLEAQVHAERDGRIAEVLVAPGTPVEAGELVARYADA